MNASRWDEALVECRSSGEPCVLVTVIGTSGSTPREAGAKMVVTRDAIFDSIGGGQLERLAMEAARAQLDGEGPDQTLHHFPLGQAARQCCGGAVAVLTERLAPALAEIALFGAGHVAHALLTVLAELPFRVRWIDTRADLLDLPGGPGLELVPTDDPASVAAALASTTPALVMTHDHDLDLQIVHALLARGGDAFVGLIGSRIKGERFRQKLIAFDIDARDLARLQCPVGLLEVPGKAPMAVAVSIAAQLLSLLHPERGTEAGRQAGIPWPALRSLLTRSENAAPAQGSDEQTDR